MYGLIKTHKVNNPVRVITSGCRTSVENLSIFLEGCLYPEVLKIESRIQDTSEMSNFTDYLNKSNILTEDCILVSFDMVYMFPNLDNQSVPQTVKNALEARQEQFPPTDCIVEALQFCLESNNSVFDNKHFLRADGTAQGSHISCSYSDSGIENFDQKELQYHPSVIDWKRFRDDVFLFRPHSRDDLDLFLNCMKNIASTKKIQFTMEVAKDILEILDLQLKFDKVSQLISADILSKATKCLTYILPSTCFSKTNIENIPKGVALRLRRICDSDSKFEKRSAEYQNYLIARDYKPSKVKKQFSNVRNTSREETRRTKIKSDFSTTCNLITKCNPMLPNFKTIFKIICITQQPWNATNFSRKYDKCDIKETKT